MNPIEPRYFFVDGKNPPRPAVALDSPIVDDTELLEWTVKAVLAPYNVDYFNYPVELNTASRRFTETRCGAGSAVGCSSVKKAGPRAAKPWRQATPRSTACGGASMTGSMQALSPCWRGRGALGDSLTVGLPQAAPIMAAVPLPHGGSAPREYNE